jgi:hypothetical protein
VSLDPDTQARLRDLFRRERRSFLQYVSQSNPWAAGKDRDAVALIGAAAQQERDCLEGLASYLEHHGVTLPYLAAYPTAFANYNFVNVRALLPRLVEELRQSIAAIEADRDAVADPEAREKLEALRAVKQTHLTELEKTAGVSP